MYTIERSLDELRLAIYSHLHQTKKLGHPESRDAESMVHLVDQMTHSIRLRTSVLWGLMGRKGDYDE